MGLLSWLKIHSRNELLLLLVVIFLAFVLRMMPLWQSNFGIEADEAIVGLMAKHMVEGSRPWPVFYYGQAYMGSFEPTLVAIVYKIFGVSNWGLKSVPLLFSLIHVALVFALARRFVSFSAAWIASLLVAVGPSTLILWSAKARGGFMELVVLGTLAFIIAIDAFRKREFGLFRYFSIGFVIGFGWWVNNQIVFYAVPIAFACAWHWFRNFSIRQSVAAAATGIFGFFIGGAPFWYKNFFGEVFLESIYWMRANSGTPDVLKHFAGYFSEALPIIFGARRFWTDLDLYPHSSLISYIVYFGVLTLCVVHYLRKPKDDEKLGLGLLLLFLLVVPVIFSCSSFGWLSKAPRYLLPLYSCLPVLAAIACGKGGFRYLGYLFALSLLVIQGSSHIYGGAALSGQPFVYQGERVAEDHQPLYKWLAHHRYDHIKTDYWIGYRVAFETREAVTFSRFRGPKVQRIPEYVAQGMRGLEDDVYVLVPLQAQRVRTGLISLGYAFEEERVGDYVVIHHLRAAYGTHRELALDDVLLSASTRESWLSNLIDSDPGTRWGSGEPQKAGQAIRLTFPQPTLVSGIELDYGFWPQDYPRSLSVEARLVDGTWCRLLDTRDTVGLRYMLESGRSWGFWFLPRRVNEIRLIQQGEHPILDWSLADLKIFRPE